MEDKIQEIMRLVLTHSGACVNYENYATIKHKENVVVAFSTIQSKLRKLVERCSVREPLSDADLHAEYLEDTSFEGECAAFLAGARYAERFHNITNTIKE